MTMFFHIVVFKYLSFKWRVGGGGQKKLHEELRELPLNIPVQVQNDDLFHSTEEMKIAETATAQILRHAFPSVHAPPRAYL